MSMELWQSLKALKARVEALEQKAGSPTEPVDENINLRVTKLENNYKMMNARLARGKTDGN